MFAAITVSGTCGLSHWEKLHRKKILYNIVYSQRYMYFMYFGHSYDFQLIVDGFFLEGIRTYAKKKKKKKKKSINT